MGESENVAEWMLGMASNRKAKMGYGNVSFGYKDKKQYLAHRIAYFIYYQVDPGELCVLHSCDNPPCCNPFHFSLGTYLDNTRDRQKKGRVNWYPETAPVGEKNGQAILNEMKVREIKKRIAQGETHTAIAADSGVCRASVSQIARGARWAHVT